MKQIKYQFPFQEPFNFEGKISWKGIPHSVYMRHWRRDRYDKGLTSTGKFRKNKKHPELAGLKGKEYKSAYKKLLKNEHDKPDSKI